MPARSPRLSITLPQDVRAILDRLATLNGVPAARIVSECMVEAAPVLHRIADAIERVRKVNAEKADLIRATLANAENEAKTAAATALALLDRLGTPGGPGGDAQQPRPVSEPPAIDLAAARTPRRRRNRPPHC